MTPPDAEPTTKERLAEALARAAELVASYGTIGHLTVPEEQACEYLEGWAEALAALKLWSRSTMGEEARGVVDEAITKFCDVLLGTEVKRA